MVTTAMILPGILILATLVSLVLWIRSKNAGWAFPTALIVFWAANLKGGIPLWISIVFWSLIVICSILFIASKTVAFKRFAIATFVVAILAAGIVFIGPMMFQPATKIQPPVPASTPAPTAAVTHSTWKMVAGDYGNNRWFADGVVEIKEAKTNAEAANAANVWLGKVKTDPNLLVGAAKYFLNRDVDKASLVTSDGWATDKAVQLVTELQILLSKSEIVASVAPVNGYNSGVENNTVVGASTAGVTGDTKAIRVTTTDGKDRWVMARCGNIVTPGKPPVPTGKTDNQPKSSNVSDYQRPGNDSTRDSGIGVKPKVPTVTTPAESVPLVVETTKPGNSNIVDTVVKPPSSETGTTAPGATAPTSGTTPRVVPPVEAGANPSTAPITVNGTTIPSTGTNSGDPGNPF